MISCGALNASNFGLGGLSIHFSAPTTTVGARAVYSCSNSSYWITGNAVRTCVVNGSWTGVEPQCEGITIIIVLKVFLIMIMS